MIKNYELVPKSPESSSVVVSQAPNCYGEVRTDVSIDYGALLRSAISDLKGSRLFTGWTPGMFPSFRGRFKGNQFRARFHSEGLMIEAGEDVVDGARDAIERRIHASRLEETERSLARKRLPHLGKVYG